MSRRGYGVRVIAGTAKGRRLDTPPGSSTRPITDRVKESRFASRGPHLQGARVLDLYAGSGALAIEALSRGAASALLVERNRAAAEVAAANLEHTGFAGVAEVRRAAVRSFLSRAEPSGAPFDLVFCDPPFDLATAEVEAVLADLAGGRGWVGRGTIVVVRRRRGDGAPAVPATWEFARERVFGDTLVLVAIVS